MNLIRAVNRQPGFRPGTRRVLRGTIKTAMYVQKSPGTINCLISWQKREMSRKVDTCHFLWERKKSPSVQLQKRQSYQSAAFKMVYPGRAVLFQTNGWILRNFEKNWGPGHLNASAKSNRNCPCKRITLRAKPTLSQLRVLLQTLDSP